MGLDDPQRVEDHGDFFGIEGRGTRTIRRHRFGNGLRPSDHQPSPFARCRVEHYAAGGPVEVPMVGLDRAVYQALIETVDRLDDRPLRFGRVDAEADARGRPQHQPLNHHRHGAGVHVDPELAAVEQSAIGPQRGPHAADRVAEGGGAADPDEGIVEAGE